MKNITGSGRIYVSLFSVFNEKDLDTWDEILQMLARSLIGRDHSNATWDNS